MRHSLAPEVGLAGSCHEKVRGAVALLPLFFLQWPCHWQVVLGARQARRKEQAESSVHSVALAIRIGYPGKFPGA